MTISPGPEMPHGLRHPCTLNINSSHLFIFGQSLFKQQIIGAYIFDTLSLQFTNVTFDVHNFLERVPYKYHRLSCALLKNDDYFMVTFDDKLLTFNLSSSVWNKMKVSVKNGVIFNSDEKQKVAFFIGPSNQTEGTSDVYMVKSFKA